MLGIPPVNERSEGGKVTGSEKEEEGKIKQEKGGTY